MHPPRHRYIECEIYTDCYNQSYTSVLETISRQALTDGWDISRSEEVVEAANMFVKSMDRIGAEQGIGYRMRFRDCP